MHSGAQEHEPMSGDDSQYTGILPPLSGPSNRRVQPCNFIISPNDRCYRAWETFLAALVLYTAWVSPFEFGFLQRPERPLSIVDNIVNGFFAIDIILTFFVAYLDKNTYLLVDNLKQIACRYASTWLLFDVVSTIPSELTGSLSFGYFQCFGFLSMFRLWRLCRVNALFARYFLLEKDRNFSYVWVRMTKLLLLALFWVHCAGCFYYRLAVNYHDPARTWIGYGNPHFKDQSFGVRYVTSIYWSVTTLAGNGTLDAQNTHDMIYVTCYVLFNLWSVGYLLGHITNLAVHGDSKIRERRDAIQAALGFAQRNQLSIELQDQMLAHLEGTDLEALRQQEAIDSLPNGTRSLISRSLFRSSLEKAYLFNGVSDEFLFQLVSKVKAEYFSTKADVILQMAEPTDFYLVVEGSMVIKNNGVEEVVGEAKPGDLCGEIGFICDRPQLFTVRAKEFSRLLRFNRTVFLEILRGKFGDGTVIVENLLRHLEGIGDPIKGVLLEMEKMLACGRIDLPLSLCFATQRGYDKLLEKLLHTHGLDPNKADNNGRTALHIAASKGSEKCVLLLLDSGADPNCTDSEGSVPLWEAILGGHESVIGTLANKGATLSPGDVGWFSCIAAEQNNLDLLEQIIRHGGDVTLPRSDGIRAIQVADSLSNFEMVKFLSDPHHGYVQIITDGGTTRVR